MLKRQHWWRTSFKIRATSVVSDQRQYAKIVNITIVMSSFCWDQNISVFSTEYSIITKMFSFVSKWCWSETSMVVDLRLQWMALLSSLEYQLVYPAASCKISLQWRLLTECVEADHPKAHQAQNNTCSHWCSSTPLSDHLQNLPGSLSRLDHANALVSICGVMMYLVNSGDYLTTCWIWPYNHTIVCVNLIQQQHFIWRVIDIFMSNLKHLLHEAVISFLINVTILLAW